MAVNEALVTEEQAKLKAFGELTDLKEKLEATGMDLSKERQLVQEFGVKVKTLENELGAAKEEEKSLKETNVRLQSELDAQISEKQNLAKEKSETEQKLEGLQQTFKKQEEELDQVNVCCMKREKIVFQAQKTSKELEQKVDELEIERTALATSYLEKLEKASAMRQKAEQEVVNLTSELEKEREKV